MQHEWYGCKMLVKCKAEGIDDRILVRHAARIKWVTIECKFLAEVIVNRILLGLEAIIERVSHAFIVLGSRHR